MGDQAHIQQAAAENAVSAYGGDHAGGADFQLIQCHLSIFSCLMRFSIPDGIILTVDCQYGLSERKIICCDLRWAGRPDGDRRDHGTKKAIFLAAVSGLFCPPESC